MINKLFINVMVLYCIMQCPYCHKIYNPSYLKYHIRYKCKQNPQHDIIIKRKKLLRLKDEIKNSDKSEEYKAGACDVIDLFIQN
jgi:hypothetical protein